MVFLISIFHWLVRHFHAVERGGGQQVAKPPTKYPKPVGPLPANHVMRYLRFFVQHRYSHFLELDDYVNVPMSWQPPKGKSKKKETWAAQIRRLIYRRRAPPPAAAPGPSAGKRAPPSLHGESTREVGTFSLALVGNLRQYIYDSMRLMLKNGHMQVPLDAEVVRVDSEGRVIAPETATGVAGADGATAAAAGAGGAAAGARAVDEEQLTVCDVVLFSDGKSTGFLACKSTVNPILLHFPWCSATGTHQAWLPIGVIIGSMKARAVVLNAFRSPLRHSPDNLNLSNYLNALNGMRVGRFILRCKFLGDYDSIRMVSSADRSNVPFPTSGNLAVEWFTSHPCSFCERTPHELYESMPAAGGGRPRKDALIQMPMVYGRLHAMIHVAGGFAADLTRVVAQLDESSGLCLKLARLFHTPVLGSTRQSYDPLWRAGTPRETSAHKAEPIAYEAVLEDEVGYQKLCDEVRAFFDDRAVRDACTRAGIDPKGPEQGLRALRVYYMYLHTDVTEDEPFRAFKDAAETVDRVWLTFVRATAPPRAGPPPPDDGGPTYVPMCTGRGISSHVGVEHIPDQQRALGRLATKLSEKGGEHYGCFAAEVWNGHRIAKATRKRFHARALLHALVHVHRARILAPPAPNMIENVAYEHKGQKRRRREVLRDRTTPRPEPKRPKRLLYPTPPGFSTFFLS